MAVFSGTVRSAELGMDTHLQVILPHDRPTEDQPRPCKVLYLLHGLGGCCDSWCRNTNVERYARDRGVALISPEVQRSFYSDMHYGLRYFAYVSSELPRLCAQMFSVSAKREDTFIAGLSMGGYGALLCALTYPESYAAVASFSGAVDTKEITRNLMKPEMVAEFTAVLGPGLTVPDEQDLICLAKKAAKGSPPRVLMTCGEQDYLYDMNRRVCEELAAILPDYTFKSWQGAHEWDFWDKSICLALDFFLS